jgi:hypothetical protein
LLPSSRLDLGLLFVLAVGIFVFYATNPYTNFTAVVIKHTTCTRDENK